MKAYHRSAVLLQLITCLTFFFILIATPISNTFTEALAQSNDDAVVVDPDSDSEQTQTIDLGSSSIFEQAWNSGFVVFMVLLILILASILSWALFVSKWLYLRKLSQQSKHFIKSFWDSRSLNELNSRLADYPASSAKEIFRSGYSELVKASQLKEQSSNLPVAINAALENLGRSLHKAKRIERYRMERYLPILAIIASASPFIGLFGTVWGIMNAFENIARTGSASLAAVAPGISEALIATAFGLAAAIPAVIGYNTANAIIRRIMGDLESFSADFLNIVERYLVTEKKQNINSQKLP